MTHRSLELLEDDVVVDHNASAAEGLHLHPLEGFAQWGLEVDPLQLKTEKLNLKHSSNHMLYKTKSQCVKILAFLIFSLAVMWWEHISTGPCVGWNVFNTAIFWTLSSHKFPEFPSIMMLTSRLDLTLIRGNSSWRPWNQNTHITNIRSQKSLQGSVSWTTDLYPIFSMIKMSELLATV